jgi:diguanylate cyclase (GGDEF)-like protein
VGRIPLAARPDPVLSGLAALVVMYGAWCLSDVGGPEVRSHVLLPFQVLCDVVFAALAHRTAALPTLSAPTRRFWRVLSLSGIWFACGDLMAAVRTLAYSAAPTLENSPLRALFFIGGVIPIVITILRHPGPPRTSGERLRFWLDCAAFLLAGAILAFAVAVVPAGAGRREVVAGVFSGALVLVATFAVVKLVLSGTAPITRRAAAPLFVAMAIAGLALAYRTGGHGTADDPLSLVLRLLPTVLQVSAPRIQELQLRADPEALERPYRAQSLLPLTGVAVVLCLLSLLPGDPALGDWVILGGVVAVALLMVGRYHLAGRDSTALIERLDTTLAELRGRECELREQSTHDQLTGLLNRAGFVAHAAQRERHALLLVDVDDFKIVNDTLGHGVGDALLHVIAERLRAGVRPQDPVARVGADEFALLVGDLSDEETEHLAERILADLAQPVRVGDHVLAVRASVGIAPFRSGGSIDALIRNADIALYAAKDRGKGMSQRYLPEMGDRIVEAARLSTQLREAIGTDQFHLVYQPIVDLDTGRIRGVETLVRWVHPERGPVSPAEFIPVAENTGLIVPLGRWILAQACHQAAAWRATDPNAAGLTISVNVAGRQLEEPGFVAEVTALLHETGLPAERLVIEVTETAVIDGGDVVEVLNDLRALGLGVALDDFGTAASSLGLLLTCPVSVLKLDRSFVEAITTTDRQAAVATAVIQMARALRLRAVAEGIETTEQAEFLRRLGYRLGQGFLFARPLPPGEITQRLAATPRSVAV